MIIDLALHIRMIYYAYTQFIEYDITMCKMMKQIQIISITLSTLPQIMR